MPEQLTRVAVGGSYLALWNAGDDDVVTFVHAGIADSRMWEGQIAAFSERFQTLRFDLRGYGLSTDPERPFSYSDDLLAVMTHAGVERAHVVAASFGGRVARDFALEHPDRVRSLALAGPAIRGATWDDLALIAGWETMSLAEEQSDIERVTATEIDLWLGGMGRSFVGIPPAVIAKVFEMQHGIYERSWDATLVQELDRPAIGRLAEIEQPMLIIVGDHERPDIVRNCQQLAEHVVGSKLIEMPEAAHLPPLEQPEAFN